MKLHKDINLFETAIKETADNLDIKNYFIEKDYWISLILKRLSESKYVDSVVFKGGTSLSKGHHLINRFSEDVDVAVIVSPGTSGNKIKSLIRTVEKEIASDLVENNVKGITSKGSRFRKSVYTYPFQLDLDKQKSIPNSIIVEINSFANPFPYRKIELQSMIGEYLKNEGQTELIKKYDLAPFYLNVLDIEQTLIEKLISLIRFSFSENYIESLSSKIRHFYDLHYILEDKDVEKFVETDEFLKRFYNVLENDKKLFDEPLGWKNKDIIESPLLNDFNTIWNKLKTRYKNELSMLAFTEIPSEENIANSMKKLISKIKAQ